LFTVDIEEGRAGMPPRARETGTKVDARGSRLNTGIRRVLIQAARLNHANAAVGTHMTYVPVATNVTIAAEMQAANAFSTASRIEIRSLCLFMSISSG
jgi:hypothetical protein